MEGKSVLGRIGAHMRANVVGYVALFVALSGVAYAGVTPLLDKKGSVDSKNIQNGSVGNRELSPKLKRGLGLAVGTPADGTYTGMGTDEVTGATVTFVTAWEGGQPDSASMTSSAAECTSPPATGFEQLGPTSWTAVAKTSTQQLTASMQVLGGSLIVLEDALLTNYDKAPCKLESVSLQLVT